MLLLIVSQQWLRFLKQNLRITEWLEGTFKGHGTGTFSLEQVAQSHPVQPDLEHFQDFQEWDIHSFSGQPATAPHHLYCRCFLPYVQSKLNPFHFKTLTLCPVTACPGKMLPPFLYIGGLTTEPSFLPSEQPQCSQHVFTGEVLQSSSHFCGLLPPNRFVVSCAGESTAGFKKKYFKHATLTVNKLCICTAVLIKYVIKIK